MPYVYVLGTYVRFASVIWYTSDSLVYEPGNNYQQNAMNILMEHLSRYHKTRGRADLLGWPRTQPFSWKSYEASWRAPSMGDRSKPTSSLPVMHIRYGAKTIIIENLMSLFLPAVPDMISREKTPRTNGFFDVREGSKVVYGWYSHHGSRHPPLNKKVPYCKIFW